MATKIDTLHPVNNLDDNLYPNIIKENIPSSAIDESKLDNALLEKINNAISLYGEQTVTGILEFINGIKTPKINDINVDEIALKSDIPSLDNYVTLDGDQTITGNKKFNQNVFIQSGKAIRDESGAWLFGNYNQVDTLEIGDLGSSNKSTISLWCRSRPFWHNADGNHTFPFIDLNNTFSGSNKFTNSNTFNTSYNDDLIINTSRDDSYAQITFQKDGSLLGKIGMYGVQPAVYSDNSLKLLAFKSDIPASAKRLYLHRVYVGGTLQQLYIKLITDSSVPITSVSSITYNKIINVYGSIGSANVVYNIIDVSSDLSQVICTSTSYSSTTLNSNTFPLRSDISITDTVTEL